MKDISYELLENYDCFKKYVLDEVSGDCTIYEVLVIVLLALKERCSESYLHLMWNMTGLFKPIYDKKLNDVSDCDIEDILEASNSFQRVYVKRIYRLVLDYSHGKDISSTNISSRDFVESLYFSSEYKCPRNIQFGTLFRYYLYLYRDIYSDSYIYRYLLPSYRNYKKIHKIPYRYIRTYDIYDCIKIETIRNKDRELQVYRILDKFAYDKGIISKRYASDIKIDKRVRTNFNTLGHSEINILKKYIGDIDIDITFSFIYTGLKLRELLHLNNDCINDHILTVINEAHHNPVRYIPINSYIESFLLPTIEYIQSISKYSYYYRRKIIENKVKRVTLDYLNHGLTPEELRLTFDNRLLVNNVPSVVIDTLRGTRTYSRRYESIYRHLNIDSLRNYLERCD